MGQGIGVKPLTKLGLPRTSRFRQTLIYPDLDMSFGLWAFKNVTIPADVSDTTHKVLLDEEYRWDLIAYREYQTPYLWWVLCLANKVLDPFIKPMAGETLRVPSGSRVNRILLTDTAPVADVSVRGTRLITTGTR